jgi:transposase
MGGDLFYSIASKIGCTAETLRNRIRPGQRNKGARPEPTSEEKERIAETINGLHKA